ncbi:MAG TPA: diguanylate cyclase [Solirubrobacterales bacterium]|nr:diguanylate cyclase [Solirubrobacterales bacterium]
MESAETKALIRICQPRFRNFSEAVEPVLGALVEVVPGTLLLGQMDSDQQACRIIGIQGDGVEGVYKGAMLPVGSPPNGGDATGSPSNSEIDQGFLDSLGVGACLSIPLEVSDGRIVGTLSALDSQPGLYGCQHAAMLGIAARMLSYEWESVERRAELRRLRGRFQENANVDSETRLLSRDAFLDLLDHDWHLAERGTVESVLVAFRVDGESDRSPSGEAMRKLAVKIAAEVLEATVRRTDRAGRIGEATLAATLVGCRPDQVPGFVERFRAALERVTRGGDPRIELSHGIQTLGQTSSPEEALGLADAAATASGGHGLSPEPVYQEAAE